MSIHEYCDYCGQKVVVDSNESGRILCSTCENHEKDKADIVDNYEEQIRKLKRKNKKLVEECEKMLKEIEILMEDCNERDKYIAQKKRNEKHKVIIQKVKEPADND